jgi:hypothetical protein
MYSFGFQYAFESGVQPNDIFFTKASILSARYQPGSLICCSATYQCFEAAKSVIRIIVERLAPGGYMRFSPDGEIIIRQRGFWCSYLSSGYFVFATFASAFLLKVCCVLAISCSRNLNASFSVVTTQVFRFIDARGRDNDFRSG